eukprot:2867432-Rhodomonas_salina.1
MTDEMRGCMRQVDEAACVKLTVCPLQVDGVAHHVGGRALCRAGRMEDIARALLTLRVLHA